MTFRLPVTNWDGVSILMSNAKLATNVKSNHFMGLRCSKGYYKRPRGGGCIWEGSLECDILRGSMCAEGMGCGRRWVRWVLRGTGTASGHSGVP